MTDGDFYRASRVLCAVAHFGPRGERVPCPGYPHSPTPRAVLMDDDPEHLADTEVDPPLGWGEDYDAFVRSLSA